MNVKKNFFYNSILLVSQYVFPMLVFPYITRVFGPSTLGLVSFVDGITDYFILFSTLGLTLTGLRAIAKYNSNKTELSKAFSELVILHLISTLIFLIIYIILILTVYKMQINKQLFFISLSKLVFNVLLIEWFYRGIEDFRFITTRTIFIKTLYVVLIFLFVKTKNDYTIYYLLTCLIVVFNSIINFAFVRSRVSFVIKGLNIKQHLHSFFTIGLYLIVTSMYTSFNIGYLGFVSSTTSVGYYSAASKLFSVILGFFTALNMVLMPRLSSLAFQNNDLEFSKLINKSFTFVVTFCFPIIVFAEVLAPQIIRLISGPRFDGAVICFRLIIPLLFILGLAQIFANQILMSFKKDREILIASIVGGALGLALNFFLVPTYHEIGTSFVLLASELSVTIVLYYFTVKSSSFRIPYNLLFKNLLLSIPNLAICYVFLKIFNKPLFILSSSIFISAIYFLIVQIFIFKNELIIPYYKNIKSVLFSRVNSTT